MRSDRLPGKALLGLLALRLMLARNVAAQDPLPPLPPDYPPPIPTQPAPHIHDHAHAEPNILAKLNPFHTFDPSVPVTVPELCKELDCLTEKLRNDGLILLKQPDVYSQARLTRARNDFDNQMSTDLGNFHLVLAARINRLDAATTTQTTALGAALAAPGTTTLSAPSASDFIGKVSGTNSPFSNTTSLFPTNGQIDNTKGAFGSLGLAPSTMAQAATTALGLGVDPTVYLDEKKRFLEHLNQIRRISQGPDQNDSSGYGLYLVRMPVSIKPGECTYQGYGADLSLNVEHEFPPDFLPTTFQSLVIADIVDHLGPFLYEAIRTGSLDDLKTSHEAKLNRPAFELLTARSIREFVSNIQADQKNAPQGRPRKTPIPDPVLSPDARKKKLTAFILLQSRPLSGDANQDRLTRDSIGDRLEALAETTTRIPEIAGFNPFLMDAAVQVRAGKGFPRELSDFVVRAVGPIVDALSIPSKKPLDPDTLEEFLNRMYRIALPDEDVKTLDDVLGIPEQQRVAFTRPVALNNQQFLEGCGFSDKNNLNLPSTRSPKQIYPLAPRELLAFFRKDNVYLIGNDASQAGRTATPNLLDVRSYLRQTLKSAYLIMSDPTNRDQGWPLPLADREYMDRLCDAIRQREFDAWVKPIPPGMSPLDRLNDELLTRLSLGRDNLRNTAIGALCWAIAVDAALLDNYLRGDAKKQFETKGLALDTESVRFYVPKCYPNPAGREVFCEYVRQRWPIITFSLDPVTDQQNIADTFNLKRDLQLAVSFAFATGQISFNQLSTFRRQIEQSSDTIALNRTITGFSFSNDNFGFRFTPRFQNPPNQRTNIGVIASQLIGGGPGPDYQTKKSKLEPGMRELTAVLLIPEFLPTMRINVDTNWFKLTDPEHLVFHTGRAMERGRLVQELRKAVLDACSSRNYRGEDLRVLQRKLAQLDAMLPMQSKVVQLPFDTMANGFDLIADGSAALAPELTGFSGLDVIIAPPAGGGGGAASSAASTTTPAGTALPAPGSTGLLAVSTSGGGATTSTVSIAGGLASIADIVVFGKFLNLLDTNVVAGGRSAAFQLLSREVMHVQIPANVTPTTDEEGKQYIEIYASTPNGISNTILVPYKPSTPAPLKTAYDLAAASANTTIYYEPGKAADGSAALIPSALPGKSPITITWDDATGVAPRRLWVTFSGTINTTQAFTFSMAANSSGQDDYSIDQLAFARDLLIAVQKVIGPTGAVPATITLTVAVQPFLPNAADNYRVRTQQKKLTTQMNVTLQSFVVPDSAVPKSSSPKTPGASAPADAGPADDQSSITLPRDGQRLLASGGSNVAKPGVKWDSDLARTSQQLPGVPALPPLPAPLNLPQPPPAAFPPTLLAPNISNDAEQVARMLTGQPLPPNPSGGQSNTIITSTATPTAAAGQGQPIVVMPAPVVVVPAKEVPMKKHGHDDRNQPGFFKKLGNRISNSMPGAGN